MGGGVSVQALVWPDDDDDAAPPLERLDWHALWDDDSAEEWILEPLLPARRLIALYSAPKVGKSLLMLEIAVAVSCGRSCLGVTPDRPRKVLYVDFENDPRGDIRERLIAMGYGPDDLGNLDYLSYPTLGGLDTGTGGRTLLAAVDHFRSEVVIVDTVSRSVVGEENDNTTWLHFYRHTGLLLKQRGVALVRLDHSGKDATKGQRGGSAKSGDVDAVWKLSRVSDSVFRLDCEANRMPVTERVLVMERRTVPRLHHHVNPLGRIAAYDAATHDIVQVLDSVGVDVAAGRPAAREALRKAGIKTGNGPLAEAIKYRKDRFEKGCPTVADNYICEDAFPAVRDSSGQPGGVR